MKDAPYAVLVLAIAIFGYIYRSRGVSLDSEVLTLPYGSLDSETFQKLDRFVDIDGKGYDPRRVGISILKYLEESSCADEYKVPLVWNQLVNFENKTSEGLEWIQETDLRKIILMKENLTSYDIDFGGILPLVNDIHSIGATVNQFFQNERPYDEDFEEMVLTAQDFRTDNYLDEIKSIENVKQRDWLLKIYEEKTVPEFRYYKEGSLIHNKTLGIKGLSHYDLRFYHTKYTPMDRVSILHRIVRAWGNFTRKLRLQTWIAHGSLLGYSFNGLILPWDDDLDVQISVSSFWKLLKLNGTLVIDYQDEVNLGKYLIDINPWVFSREKHNPENKIDARFIDLESGLYIDITVLTFNDNVQDLKDFHDLIFDENKRLELSKLVEPYYEQIVTETEELQARITHSVDKSLQAQNQLVSCKDYHFYNISELTPLNPTIFEGGIIMVPNHIEEQLMREYKKKSLYLFEFNNFKFDRQRNLWVSDHLQYEYNQIMEEFLDLHYQLKQTTLKRHVIKKELLKTFPAFRVEPWIREWTNKIKKDLD